MDWKPDLPLNGAMSPGAHDKGGESKRPDYRSRHRMRSHAEAHLEQQDGATPLPAIEHPLVSSIAPELVVSDHRLVELIAELRSAGQFGYDTEFIGEHTFYPRLCLIQVATSKHIALIDPLSGVDLKPFWELLADPAVEKIVHAGLHDLEPVLRHLDRPPANIFDTQLAAGFIGLRYPLSTSNLILEITGIDFGNAPKFSQWDHRPLTPVQMHYAGNDVRYLPLLRQKVADQLNVLGNVQWCAEELQSLAEPETYRFDANSQRLRVRGVESLDPRQRAVLRALVSFRERTARLKNLPTRTFLRDEVLFALASVDVKCAADLDEIRGLPRPVKLALGEEIIGTIHQANATFAATPPAEQRKPRDRWSQQARIDRLYKDLHQRCKERSIDPALVASKREISNLVWAAAEGQPVHSIPSRLTRGWRWTLLNDLLLKHLSRFQEQ